MNLIYVYLKCNLQGARLGRATHSGARLIDTNLQSADLRFRFKRCQVQKC
ncbi:pentapeptide repeat-containing protein [Peribacillus frigoritolerans]